MFLTFRTFLGETSVGNSVGLGSLKDFGFQYEEIPTKNSIFSGVRVYQVTATEHNNPEPVLRNKNIMFHTCVLSQCNIGEQGKIMNQIWSTRGFASHAFFFYNGDVLLWRDPSIEKGQMAGIYNDVSLEALVETEGHYVSKKQIISIQSWIRYYNETDKSIKVENLLSHSEARRSTRKGEIYNIEEMRRIMVLGDSKI